MCSVEEIALEFILWEDEVAHSERLRRDFIREALEKNLGNKPPAERIAKFLRAYEALYRKIYQHKQGNIVKEERATPESVRQLLNADVKRNAA